MTEIKILFEGRNLNLRRACEPPAQYASDWQLLKNWRKDKSINFPDPSGEDAGLNCICVLDSEEEVERYKSSLTVRNEISSLFMWRRKTEAR